jgi:hypothetical protein
MFSADPALSIKERVSSNNFWVIGALAAQATKAKYLKMILKSLMFLDRSVGDDVEKISVIETKTEIINYYKIWQHIFLDKSKQIL